MEIEQASREIAVELFVAKDDRAVADPLEVENLEGDRREKEAKANPKRMPLDACFPIRGGGGVA
ncbi:hypothetical protein [Oryzicola mucosus]|uniref:Uncharacterized protein n=1 Tax=Oryzicola mucosus TaxID=2767425 RepID=A0A8J6PH96_9HYPH|nr:hypothetical protein [Oryzicola mucosus]MBD0413406.1 hypothetical protein [Oryzicola mucosus]